MAAAKSIWPYVLAFIIATLGAEGAGEPANNDPLQGVSLKATGIGKIAEAKRGTGQGRLTAERAAEMNARRNLALVIGKVTVEGRERDKDIFVSAFMRGARVTEKKMLPDGTVEVTVELPLSEVARNFAEMQRLWIRAEENRHRLEGVFKKTKDDLKTIEARLDKLQETTAKVEAKLKGIEGQAPASTVEH